MNTLQTLAHSSRHRTAARAHAQTGVGLIEVLISILIFSFGILGLVGLQARAVSFSTSAEDMNRAALLAEDASAQMWNSNNPTLDPVPLAAWQARATASGNCVTSDNCGTIQVTGRTAEIIVKWKTPSTGAFNRYVTQVTIP